MFHGQCPWFNCRYLFSLFFDFLLESLKRGTELAQSVVGVLPELPIDLFIGGNVAICMTMSNPEQTRSRQTPNKTPEAINSGRSSAWHHASGKGSREEKENERRSFINQISPTQKWPLAPRESLVLGIVIGLISGTMILYWFLSQNRLLAGN